MRKIFVVFLLASSLMAEKEEKVDQDKLVIREAQLSVANITLQMQNHQVQFTMLESKQNIANSILKAAMESRSKRLKCEISPETLECNPKEEKK